MADRWVILAPERALRPMLYGPSGEGSGPCPFCPGNEGLTPPEVAAWGRTSGAADGPGWLGRVVPNRYPALGRGDAAGDPGVDESDPDAFFLERPGRGGHEVVVETPEHAWRPEAIDVELLAATLKGCAARAAFWAAVPGVRSVLVFKNHGEAAGATIPHPHFQLLALPLVPKTVREEALAADRHYRQTGTCLLCHVLNEERAGGDRMVLETPSTAAFTPFASRVPYETWILPRVHEPAFQDSGILDDVAVVLSRILASLDRVAKDAAWNLIVHTAPQDPRTPAAGYHWHLELLPRTVGFAGFEWGAGLAMNPMAPEAAARALREGVRA